MQLSFVALFVAFAASANALPVSTKVSCNIAKCVAALAPTVVSCVSAAASEGSNLIADAGCLTSAADTALNFPSSCDQCLEEFDIPNKLEDAGNKVVDVAEEGAQSVGNAAQDVGDDVSNFFGSIV